MAIPAPNPFDGVDDVTLVNYQLALQLACNRAKPVMAHKREQWFCALGKVLQLEATARGLTPLAPPYRTGALPRGPQAV